MYAKDSWYLLNHIEHEYKYPGNYGAKGEKRKKKKKPTPEQVLKQNQYNKEVRYRRLLRNNFYPGDFWVTLKYKRGGRKSLEALKKDKKKFLDILRAEYRERGQPLKWIGRLEIGKRGGLHVHMVINRLAGIPDTDILIRDAWSRATEGGSIDYTTLRESGGYEELAKYIVKQAGEEIEGQMKLFSKKDQKQLTTVSSSRNLDRPQPVRKLYRHWTMRRILQDGPEPTPGYYIDDESIVTGRNPFTGLSYYKYTEIRIRPIDRREVCGREGLKS